MEPKIDIDRIAELAKIRPDDKEKEELVEHFRRMLKYFEKLRTLQLDAVEPLRNPHEGLQRMRSDTPRKGVNREDVLESAPDVRDH